MQPELSATKLKFINFLKEYEAWDEWFNFTYSNVPNIEEWLQRTDSQDWILKAFTWNLRDGVSWEELHSRWLLKIEAVPSPNFTLPTKVAKSSIIKTKLSYLRWRLKFKRVQFYTLNNENHCTTCDANSSCNLEYGYVNICKSHHQLKLRRKK